MSATKPTNALISADFSPLSSETSAKTTVNNSSIGDITISGNPMIPTAPKIRAEKKTKPTEIHREVRFSKVVEATEIQTRKELRRRDAGSSVTAEIRSGRKLKIRLAMPSKRAHPYGPPIDRGTPGVSQQDIANADKLYANLSVSSDDHTIRSTDGEATSPKMNSAGPLSILKPSELNSRIRRRKCTKDRPEVETPAVKFVTTRKRLGRKNEAALVVSDTPLKKRKVCNGVGGGMNDENTSDTILGKKNRMDLSTKSTIDPDHGTPMDEEPVRIEDPAMVVVPVNPDEPAALFMDDAPHSVSLGIIYSRESGTAMGGNEDTAPAIDEMISTQSRKTTEVEHGGMKRQLRQKIMMSANETILIADETEEVITLDDTLEAPALDDVVVANFSTSSEGPAADVVYGPTFKHSIDINQQNWSSDHQMIVQGLIDAADFACLRKGARDERLTDNCVYFGLLQVASMANSNGQNVSVFAPQLYTQWRRNQQQPNGNNGFTRDQILEFAYVKENQTGRKLEDFLMPLHRDNGKHTASSDAHWSLAFYDSKKCCIVIYDSLKSTKKATKEKTIEDMKEMMEKLLSPEAYRRLKVRYCYSNHVEYQKGGIACGIHTIVNARRLMEGRRSLVNRIGEKINQRNERDYLHAVLTSVKHDLDEAVFHFAQNPIDTPPQVPGPMQALNQRSRRDHTDTIRRIRRCIEYYRRRR